MINNQLAHQLLQLLDEVKAKLHKTDTENIQEFIDHTEYVLAYEILCTQIEEYNVQISNTFYENLIAIGISMKIDSSMWLSLKGLITTPSINMNESEENK